MEHFVSRFDDQTGQALGLDSALEVWHRRKWVGLAVFAAVAAGAATLALSLPDIYRATATVLVDRQEVSESFVRSSVTAELETRIQTIRQRVMSRARLEQVISRLGLYPEVRNKVPIEAVVDRMRRDIQLELQGVDQASGHATIAFALSYSGRDPQTVAKVANTLVAFYVEENAQSRERQAARTADFLAAQVTEVKQQLDEQERLTKEFAILHSNEMPEQLAANSAALERLNAQLRLNGDYQLRNMERRERLESERVDSVPVQEELTTPAAQLTRLRRELADLRRQFSDQYPDVIRLTAQIAALEKDVARGGGAGRGATIPSDPAARREQALAEVDRELRSLKQEEAAVKREIVAYEARVEDAPKRQREIEDLSHGQQSTRDRYQALVKQYEDAKLAASLEQGKGAEQLRVLDPAIPPTMPAAPNRFLLLVMGFVAAVALGACAIVALERLDSTFHTADDLRSFINVPMLATIRRIVTESAARRERRRFALMVGATAVGLALIVAGTHHVAAGNERIVRLTARGNL